MLRRCGRCKKEKTEGDFGCNRSESDGKNVTCKACVREIQHERRGYKRQWSRKNRVRVNAKAREWVAKNPQRRKEISDKSNVKRNADPERRELYLACKREHYRRNKEKWADGTYSFAKEPKRRYAVRRKANEKLHQVPYKLEDVFKKTGGECWWCRHNKAESVDHVIPLSKGGDDCIENVVPACQCCNSSKKAKVGKDFEKWLEQINSRAN